MTDPNPPSPISKARRSRCSDLSCQASIAWVYFRGRLHPINPEPALIGNLTLNYDPESGRVHANLVSSNSAISADRFVSHYATCKNPDRFRPAKAASK